MAPKFSDEQDEILVEEVAKHPSLWQLSHPKYKDQRLKDNIWAVVAEKIGKPVDDCKKRWRNIKDTYDRKKMKKTVSAAPPTKKGKKWALEEKLSFLQPAEEHRGSFSNVTATEEEEFVVAHLEKTAERNEIIKNLLSAEQNLDEIDLFFQSIAKSVKKLPPHLQHRAKVETLTTIGKLEVEMLISFHPAPFQYHPSSTPASDSLSASGSTENNPHSPPYA
ncbi:hypothetical protein SK128_012123 [Halocaridina rubra]|uniref:MADF domain-containing protein n=1 Tax=Halocaridina rubra TaxID=373956 RepID=A0AAN8WRL4_HALRR